MSQEQPQATRLELLQRIRDLEALVEVYDITVMVLFAVCDVPESIRSQVETAKEAYLMVMGEPSAIGFSRYNPEQEKPNDPAGQIPNRPQ